MQPSVAHRVATPEHAVQFYDNDAYLAEQAAEFVTEGMARGEAGLVVATQRHLDDTVRALTRRGCNVQRDISAGHLTLVEARGLISRIVGEAGALDPACCHGEYHDLIARCSANGRRKVRGVGEVVDLLWRDGRGSAAIQLEELWTEFATTFGFSLLCAYRLDGFEDATHTAAFDRICGLHSHARTTESFASLHRCASAIDAARFEQRSRALDAELARRGRLEAELRDSTLAVEHARSAVDQANRVKSQFLAVMSHELRTPLNAIGGFASLLEMGVHGEVNAEQRDALARIQRSQRHLLELINQVLNFAKLETHGVRYEISGIPLASVMGMVDALVLPKLVARGIRYVPAECGTLTVQADREKLEQILINLLSNASKFTNAGGTVSVECTADDRTVYVGVRDTGIGIPAEQFAAIFEPFVQLESNYTRTRDGVGLGLATSRQLARAMDGDLTVTSVVGEGSTFTLALPRAVR